MELKRLHQRLGATILYVTHDQTEAMTMGAPIVVMKDGVVQQVDTPDGIYHRPANTFVATFVGTPAMNLFGEDTLDATGGDADGDSGDTITGVVGSLDGPVRGLGGPAVTLGIRPEEITLMKWGRIPERSLALQATVRPIEPMGHEHIVYLDAGPAQFEVRTGND